MADGKTTEESPAVLRTARRWLVWQHGMADEEAADALRRVQGNLVHPNSRIGQQVKAAIDVGIFVAEGHA